MANVVIQVENRNARGVVAAVLREMRLQNKFTYHSRKEVADSFGVPLSRVSSRFIGYDIPEPTAMELARVVEAAARMENESGSIDTYVE